MAIHPRDKQWVKKRVVKYGGAFLPRTPRLILGMVQDSMEIRDNVRGTVRLVHPETIEEYQDHIEGGALNVSAAVSIGKIAARIYRKTR